MYREKCRMTSNIAFHRSQSETSRQDEELMQNSNRALVSETHPLEKLRLLCLSRGAAGVLGLGRTFRRLDKKYNDKQLNKAEFIHNLKETGLQLSHEDAESLFDHFDTKKSGLISLDEFLNEIRPPMHDSRRAIVEQAFRKLDKSDDGIVSVEDLRAVYSPEAHSRYISGEETADEIFNKFLVNFETDGIVDGKVTLEEFMNYYSAISMAIDSDCSFDLMIRQAYKL
ncbi:calcyphosin-like protein [Aricia agestis]|uniref:calcyphosin-like protein n=1 Tax=Aricia agestis TaxID=91739 RepID=UPI001C20A213|nr:calcyphosin-like protein [Aricia agestis]